jgi:hypothetical protein
MESTSTTVETENNSLPRRNEKLGKRDIMDVCRFMAIPSLIRKSLWDGTNRNNFVKFMELPPCKNECIDSPDGRFGVLSGE